MISLKDNIAPDEAQKIIKKGFHIYMQEPIKKKKGGIYYRINKMRAKIGVALPLLKAAYRKFIQSAATRQRQLHYDVLQSSSPYYADFEPIKESFEGFDTF